MTSVVIELSLECREIQIQREKLIIWGKWESDMRAKSKGIGKCKRKEVQMK